MKIYYFKQMLSNCAKSQALAIISNNPNLSKKEKQELENAIKPSVRNYCFGNCKGYLIYSKEELIQLAEKELRRKLSNEEIESIVEEEIEYDYYTVQHCNHDEIDYTEVETSFKTFKEANEYVLDMTTNYPHLFYGLKIVGQNFNKPFNNYY